MKRRDLISNQPAFSKDAQMLRYRPFAISSPTDAKSSTKPLVLKRPENGYWFLINKFPRWEIRTSRFLQGRGKRTMTCGQLFFYSPLPLKASVAKPGWMIQEGGLFVSQMRIFDELEEELQTGWRKREESRGVLTTCLSACRYTREERKASKVN